MPSQSQISHPTARSRFAFHPAVGVILTFPRPARYGAAVAAALAAVAAGSWVNPEWGTTFPFVLFLLAIMLSGWVGGLGPGLLSTLLLTAVARYWLDPWGSWVVSDERELVSIVLLGVVGALISVLNEAWRRGIVTAARTAEELSQLQSITDTALSTESTETLIRALLTRLRAALRSDTTTILLADADGRHLTPFASDGMEAEVGGEIQVPIGSGVAGHIAVSEGPVIVEDLSQVEVVSPILRSRVRSLVGTPLRAGGRLIGVVHAGSATLRTFTRDDARLLSLAADRIGAAIERTRLHEAEQAARHAAETADRQKSSFLATASHDLRQPLQTLGLLNGALRRLVHDEDAAYALREQEVAIGVMSRLLNALLDISKLESGAVKPEVTTWSIGSLFEQMRSEFTSVAANKGLQLRVQPIEGWVHSDQSLIGQILRNLLTNAIKYTRQGHVLLRAGILEGRVLVEVVDTGIGMAPQELTHIYDDFYQIGVSSNTTREGYGLGLSIVSRIVKLLNLEIDVRSEPGKGSTFALKLPLGAKPPPNSGSKASSGAPEKRESGTHCVLVVEDDVAVLNATRMLLKAEGYRVITAGTLAQALEQIREIPEIELLITDYHLADGETGLQVISATRNIRGPKFKAVMITADTSSAARSVDDDEALSFLSKPVNPPDLIGVLDALLGSRAGA